MYAVTAAEFTALRVANTSVNRYIPLWSGPVYLRSNYGLQFVQSVLVQCAD